MPGTPEQQAGQVRLAERKARIRSLCFGEMNFLWARRRRRTQGFSFALGLLAAVGAWLVPWSEAASVPAGLAAVAAAWALSAGLDRKLLDLARLQTAWESLRIDLGDPRLCRDESGAGRRFEALQRRARDLEATAPEWEPSVRECAGRWGRHVDSGTAADGGHARAG